MKQYKINGINLYEYGEKENPVIIFIHSFPMCNRMWDPQIEEFQDNFHLIVYDIRGFGYSDEKSGPFTIDTHVDDLMKIIEELKIDKPVICGLSMGGYIVLRALERHQEMFKAAILSDTRPQADDNTGKIKRAEQIKQIRSGGRKEYLDTLLSSLLSPSTLKGDENKQKIVKFVKDIMSWQRERSIAAALLTLSARTDTTRFLEKINIPVLILAGEEDALISPDLSKEMHSKIKNSRLSIISGAGHFSNLENSEKYNSELLLFLNNLA